MPPFNTVDIILAGLLAVGLLRGVLRGLSGELASIISLAAACAAGWYLYRPLGVYLNESTSLTEVQADTLSFAIIIVGALILLWALRVVLKQLMAFSFKGLLERIGGGILGTCRYAVFLVAVIGLVHLFGQGATRREVVEESFIGRHVSEQLMPIYEEWAQRHPTWPTPPEPFILDDYVPDDFSMPEDMLP